MDGQKLVCERCGAVTYVSLEKRRPKEYFCSSCKARPAKSINYGLEKSCKPWAGEFDDLDNPLLDGHLVLPGLRVCGHRDCVEISHCR